jgi:hypothetical protein
MKRFDITLKTAFKLFLWMIGFFIFLKLFSLEEYSSLRLINVMFFVYFSNQLISKSLLVNKSKDFFPQFRSVFVMNCMAIIASGVSLCIYSNLFDANFIADMVRGGEKELRIDQVVFAILMEGFYSALIVSLIVVIYRREPIQAARNIEISDY